MNIGNQISNIRKEQQLTQEEFGRLFHVTRQTVSNWENENILPSIELLVKIAAFFQVSADYLLGIDQRQRLDVSDLPLDVVTHIQMLIDDIRKSPFQQ